MRHVLVLGAAIALVGCGDPLADFETLSDVPLAESPAPETPVSASPEAPIAEASDPPVDAPVDTAEAQPRSGFFGLLQRTRQNMAQAAAEVEAEGTQLAALADAAPEADSDEAPAVRATPVQKPDSTGWQLFGKTPAAFAATDVPFGTILPFGTVGRVCDARGKEMGTAVEKGPAKGFAVYDTAPGSATARTYYLTGFSDGCPRQLTAVNVLIGSPSLYDMLHYGPAAADLPYGETDKAYEKVKAQVCGVARKKPCGNRIKRLERSTVFVNAYDSFGNLSQWSEMLIHDGQILAKAMKSSE